MSALHRFFGGNPFWVIVRLLVLSIVVGIVLAWLGVTPLDILERATAFVRRLVNRGYDTVQELLGYLAIGAVIVIPIWLIMRLMRIGKGR